MTPGHLQFKLLEKHKINFAWTSYCRYAIITCPRMGLHWPEDQNSWALCILERNIRCSALNNNKLCVFLELTSRPTFSHLQVWIKEARLAAVYRMAVETSCHRRAGDGEKNWELETGS